MFLSPILLVELENWWTFLITSQKMLSFIVLSVEFQEKHVSPVDHCFVQHSYRIICSGPILLSIQNFQKREFVTWPLCQMRYSLPCATHKIFYISGQNLVIHQSAAQRLYFTPCRNAPNFTSFFGCLRHIVESTRIEPFSPRIM